MNHLNDERRRLAIRAVETMAVGTRADFDALYHPRFTNREARDEPPACRGEGPAAAWATALWLRGAYAELGFTIHEAMVEGALVAIHCTMHGQQVGPVEIHGADGRVEQVFPPRGRRFAVTQTHWIRLLDNQTVEHWANRDDLGMAQQLGWLPPSPLYVSRMLLARRRARRRKVA